MGKRPEVLLFHHAQGRTAGVLAFADAIRKAGHTVHVPDLYAGPTFDDLSAGVAHAREAGFDPIIERGLRTADALPHRVVYAGFSLGALPAQELAQTRPGAAEALLFEACAPVAQFGRRWPPGVPVQVGWMATTRSLGKVP